jgi:hypothetical protein
MRNVAREFQAKRDHFEATADLEQKYCKQTRNVIWCGSRLADDSSELWAIRGAAMSSAPCSGNCNRLQIDPG